MPSSLRIQGALSSKVCNAINHAESKSTGPDCNVTGASGIVPSSRPWARNIASSTWWTMSPLAVAAKSSLILSSLPRYIWR